MTRSKLHSLSGVAWHGVAWHSVVLRGMALALGFIAGGGKVPEALVAWVFIGLWGACPGCFRAVLAVSGSFAN